jgi:acetyl-CoA carboxylase biotin carboxyl carrier protein
VSAAGRLFRGLCSIEITSDKGIKIRISKSPQQRGAVQVAAPIPLPPLAAQPVPRLSPAQGLPAVGEGDASTAPAAPKPMGLEVKSPMVGTFSKSQEPGAKAYVAVGDRVAKGQIVCIIEAMKIMNEIESEYAGVVREILVQDAQPVEYGQVLFTIDPNG